MPPYHLNFTVLLVNKISITKYHVSFYNKKEIATIDTSNGAVYTATITVNTTTFAASTGTTAERPHFGTHKAFSWIDYYYYHYLSRQAAAVD